MSDRTRAVLEKLAQQLILTLDRPVMGPARGGYRLSEHFVEPVLETEDGALVSTSSVFDGAQRIILLGGAGAGKTTLLHFRAWQTAHAFLEGNDSVRCPLLIPVRHLRDLGPENIFDSIVSASFPGSSRTGLTQEYLRQLLEEGDVELLIDGLDEVAAPVRLGITRIISDVLRRHPNVPATVSSRPAALSVNFPGFSVYSLPGFNQSQLRSLVDRLAKDRPVVGDRFYDIVIHSPQFSDLAKLPLMVHLLWSVFVSRDTIPTNPAFLYSDFTDYLLSTWEQAKGLGQRSGVTIEQKRTILENIALQAANYSHQRFGLATIYAALNALGLSTPERREEIVDELLSSGLILSDSAESYSFVHKSFLEYFAARAVVLRPQEVVQFLDTPGADEVLVFACGLMNDVGPLIEAAIQRRRIVLAAKCISQGRTRNNELKKYVIKEFTREVGQPFVNLLARNAEAQAEQGAQVRRSIDLLHLLDSALDPRLSNCERGARFEDFAVGFFNETLKVVSQDLHTENGELDLIVEIIRSDPFWMEFGGDALVECKNWTSHVPLNEVGAFLSKVNQGRVKLAFFLSVSGFTEDARRTLRNHAANVTAPLVVPLTGTSIKNALMADVILEEFLKDEIRAMKYLRKY